MSLLDLRFEELGKKQSELFHLNNQVFIECLVKFKSVRHTLTYAYKSLIRLKKLSPIESLPLNEKTNLWEMTKEYAANRLEKDEMIELSQALLTLEYYLQ
jgi:hypothetical protein